MSNSIYDILGFYNDPNTFILGAKSAISASQQRIIQNATNRVLTIARECDNFEEREPDAHSIETVYRKFKSKYTNLNVNDFTSRETRNLIYCMHQFYNDAMFIAMGKLLNTNWKNSFINGLLFYLLTYWDSADQDNLKLIIAIFKEKLRVYTGKRDKYLLLQKNSRFFNLNGAETLGLALRKKDAGQSASCSILTAPSIYFSLYRNNINLEYYSKVIVSYFGRDAINKLDMLREVLKHHNYSVTAKRIIPLMITSNTDKIEESKQEYIRAMAIELIGDPELIYKWKIENGTEEEKQNLEEARVILNKWVKQKFISIFFEKCVNEEKRKKYWLEHIDWVDNLEIWCTPLTMALLQEDTRISSVLNTKVKVLGNEQSTNTSVLIMTIGNYYFIEFSDVGCLYLVQRRSPMGFRILEKRFSNFQAIRRMQVDLIQDFYINRPEGKIEHRSGWEQTLEKWMERYLYNILKLL